MKIIGKTFIAKVKAYKGVRVDPLTIKVWKRLKVNGIVKYQIAEDGHHWCSPYWLHKLYSPVR